MSISSQEFESYVPVYDTVPEKWEDAHPFLVEQLKKISNGVNLREIGWYLDEELLSGKAFIPGVVPPGNSGPIQFRQILRKVIDFSPLPGGPKSLPHGIVFDVNFTLMQLYGAATNSVALVAEPIPNGADTITMNATNIIVTTAATYDRAFIVVEYIQEL